MQKQFYLVVLAFISLVTPSFAQFDDNSNNDILSGVIDLGGYRTGLLGVGFPNAAALRTAIGSTTLNTVTPRARFTVRDGILAHHVSDTIGNFAGKWCGLGIGNPGGPVQPYGLAIADTGSVGFYNIIREVFENATRKNTVAGFGAEGNNANRFIIRAYSGTNAADGRDILIANPNGAVGINAEPQASFWVDATRSNLDSVPVRAIAIRGNQPLPVGSTSAASAIGAQANASLAGSGIAVEGLRAQIPDFATVAQTLAGVAANLQTVKNNTGTSALDVITPALSVTDEYAELTWQDLDFGDTAVVDCDVFPIADAEELDKFFISFRNNKNANPFAAGNKLPVMTFQANGRVGIGTLQPTSGSCTPTEQRILLDVNGLINAGGTLVGSDRRFKKDIETIPNSMELIRKMRGTTYTLNASVQQQHGDRLRRTGGHGGGHPVGVRPYRPHFAQLQPERRRRFSHPQRGRFARRAVYLRLAGEWAAGAGAEDERGAQVMSSAEFALNLVEGVCFGQDFFRRDSTAGAIRWLRAIGSLPHHGFAHRQSAAHHLVDRPCCCTGMRALY